MNVVGGYACWEGTRPMGRRNVLPEQMPGSGYAVERMFLNCCNQASASASSVNSLVGISGLSIRIKKFPKIFCNWLFTKKAPALMKTVPSGLARYALASLSTCFIFRISERTGKAVPPHSLTRSLTPVWTISKVRLSANTLPRKTPSSIHIFQCMFKKYSVFIVGASWSLL